MSHSLQHHVDCPWNRLIIIGMGLFCLLCSPAFAAPPPAPKHILILHSYHPELSWTAGVIKGMNEVMATAELALQSHVEYLDAKRNPDRVYLDHIDNLLQHKLRNRHFDLILVSDNEALDFALRHREELFAQVPIVFCGISNLAMREQVEVQNLTGVEERPSFRETVELALQLHPGTRELVFIGRTDDPSEALTRNALQSLAKSYPTGPSFTFWDNLSASELKVRLPKLQSGQLIFRIGSIKDEDGRVWSFVESTRFIRQAAAVPHYGFYDNVMGEGILGGKLVSATSQGRLAAQQGLRILQGEPLAALPIISTDSNPYLFDDRELRRFGIRPQQLPAGSIRLHQPPTFYSVSKHDVWLVSTLFASLLAIAGLLVRTIQVRRKGENALRISEERLRLALQGSQDGLWDWDATSGRNIVDERWCSMLGYTKGEIEENIDQWAKLVHPDDLPLILAAQKECVEGRTTHFNEEFRMQTKSGNWKWILGRGTVVDRQPDGRPMRLTGTHKDMSRQKASEQALQEAVAAAEASRDKIDAILKSMTDGLIVTDTANRIILINDTARQLLGLGPQTAFGQRVDSLVDAPAYAEQLAQTRLRRESPPAIDIGLHHQGLEEMRVIQSRTCLVQNQEGVEAGVITLLQDVTRLREMDRIKTEFISTAAHELRTPLAAILGFAELMLQGDFERDQQREFLAIIEERAQTLSDIVDDLLDLSRIESGRLMALERSLCSLEEILIPLVAQYRLAANNHQFETVLSDHSAELWVDRGKIGQVMENLLSNAVKYSPKGGQIRVTSCQVNDSCEITVTDQGIGMTAIQVDRVFDKFYRADTGDTAIGGLGLGMAIVKNIVEAHGGSIWVTSLPGAGTRVSFTLPLVGG